MNRQRIFTQVDYRQFRQYLAQIPGQQIRTRGYETEICDADGDIQAIVHAASIDENGRCHPASYHVRSASLCLSFPVAA